MTEQIDILRAVCALLFLTGVCQAVTTWLLGHEIAELKKRLRPQAWRGQSPPPPPSPED